MYDSPSPEEELLAACQEEIEGAWNDAKDDAPVHRLAAAHPELAEELYEFFACVVEGTDALGPPPSYLAEMDRRVRAMLAARREGVRAEAPAEPKSFLALVRDTTGASVDAIAATMMVTPDFLVDASEQGRVLTLAARLELVRRARGLPKMTSVDEGEVMASFDAGPTARRAASRKKAYAPSNVTYAAVIKRSGLSAEDKRFWLGLA